jgi:hypothetical protein
MSPNATWRPAFSALRWGSYGLNLVLIAVALFYDSTGWWICSILASLTIYYTSRKRQEDMIRMNDSKAHKNDERNALPQEQPVRLRPIETQEEAQQHAEDIPAPQQQRALMQVPALLPGLQPICLN